MIPVNAPLQTRLIKPAELTDDDLAAWHNWRMQSDALQSACFHPSYIQTIGAVRSDVEVAVISDHHGPAAYFPFQRNRLNFARPAGGRLSDFHGVIARPGFRLSAQELLEGCGLAAWDFTHLPVEQTALLPPTAKGEPSPYIDISQGFDAYVEDRWAAGSKIIVTTQRKARKMEREVGPLRFDSHVADLELLKTMMAWKSHQYQRTGFGDVFSFPWTVALLERILDQQTESFSGRLSSLHAGDRLIAIHFGMQTETVFHYWFPAYSIEFEKYSPGLVLLLEIIADAASRGIRRIDLGKGQEEFKHSMKSGSIDVAVGSLERETMIGSVRRRWRQTRDWLKVSPWGAPVRASARFVRPLREWLSFR